MKYLSSLLALLMLANPATAENDSPALAGLLAGARDLGQVNGVALACNQATVVERAKAMMILRAPKTRRFGEAFEEASSAAYNAQATSGGACPEAVVQMLKLEMTELRMQEFAAKAEAK